MDLREKNKQQCRLNTNFIKCPKFLIKVKNLSIDYKYIFTQ